MILQVVSKSNTRPVSLELLKQQARITHNAEDTLLLHYLDAATEYIEGATSRALRSITYDLKLGCFVDEIDLPVGPVQSVTSVKYIDSDDVEQTVDVADYSFFGEDDTTGIVTSDDWPSVTATAGAVTVRFVAGYATADDVPAKAKQAVLLLATHYYQNREATTEQKQQLIPFAVRSLITSLDVGRYAGADA